MPTNPANIHAALVEAHKDLTNPHKNAKANTGQYAYGYVTLDQVLSHVRPVLAKHGLAVSQSIGLEDGRLGVTTTIHHSSGETLTFGPLAGPSGSTWQALGSGITYARRYGLLAALSLSAGDEDDDGAAASVEKAKPEPPKPVATDEDVLRFYAGIAEAESRLDLKRIAEEIAAHHLDPEVGTELRAIYTSRWGELS